MKVSELGEFGLIELLSKMVARSQSPKSQHQLITGIGDDAAAWYDEANTHLATVDSLIQDVHFSLDTTPWKELGWKALAANLSDIAAMGGLPRYALVSLGLPNYTEVEDVSSLYEGMIELAQDFEVAIVGGDTCRAPVVSITITVLGTLGNKHMLTRSAAKPGDVIAVTGYLGSAAAGLEMLTHHLRLENKSAAYLKEAFFHPRPRVTEGRLLIREGVKTAIDISDGLVSDLKHICQASQVSARVEIDRLPIHSVVKDGFGDKALEMALTGGEDYELLFTAGAEVIDRVQLAASCPITIIGKITAEEGNEVSLIDIDGNPFNLHKAGWEHFKIE